MKVGDKLKFKKFNWVIVKKTDNRYWSGVKDVYYYRVFRKYFKGVLPLSNTKCCYSIQPWRWNFLKKQLAKNPNYHYTMSLWSNNPR